MGAARRPLNWTGKGNIKGDSNNKRAWKTEFTIANFAIKESLKAQAKIVS